MSGTTIDRRPQPGFTLIELLVVIAIIALLIGILLPALGSARESSRGVVCAARMSQVALGWSIYADENRGVAVPGQPGRYADDAKNVYFVGNGDQYRPRWFAMMGASAGFYAFAEPSPLPENEHSTQVINDVFICPSTSEWTSTRNHPYGYNYQFLGNTRFHGDNEAGGFVNYPVLVDRIDGSRTVLAADCMGTAAGKPEADRTPNLPDRQPPSGPHSPRRARLCPRSAPPDRRQRLRRYQVSRPAAPLRPPRPPPQEGQRLLRRRSCGDLLH